MNALRILLLEDNSLDAGLTTATLADEGLDVDITTVESAYDFRSALEGGGFDVIFADDAIPSFKGISALEIAQTIAPTIPFLFVSGTLGEEPAIDPLKNEAADHLVKDRLQRLVPSVRRALREAGERTERLQAEKELKKAKAIAEATNRAKDQFLAALSHELRTPLTPVLASIHALEEHDAMPEDTRPLVEIIRRNVELEARLIDDLLDLTRIIKGTLSLNRSPVETHLLARHVAEICTREIEEKNLSLRLELDARQSFVMADPARLQQVIWNLLKNAVKFTPERGRITIRTSNRSRETFHLEIIDTGIGIDGATLPKIFEAFEQGTDGIAGHFGGLGMGLAISKALIDLHGGTLTASSDGTGKGATFTLGLPTIVPETREKEEERSKSDEAPAGSRFRILIVDDHEDTRKVMQMLLERRGYAINIAQSVRSALDLLSAHDFDLLISDIGLPDGTGIDLLNTLTRQGRSIKAIALSGYGMEEDIQRSRNAGFFEHLTKPVSIKRLQEVIEELAKR